MHEFENMVKESLTGGITKARLKREHVKAAGYLKKHVGTSAYNNALHCGDVFVILDGESGKNRRFKTAYFCKQRMCPACAYRASLANAVQLSAIARALWADGRVGIMVTVTASECQADELSGEILRYNRAWHNLMKLNRYSAWADHIRKFEVTYNAETDTYQPYIHALVFVRPGYFGGKNYVSRAKLIKDWRRIMKDDCMAQADTRRTTSEDWQVITEMAKCAVKSDDYLKSQELFDVFYTSLKGKRLVGYSGRCSELRAEYRAGGLREYVNRDLPDNSVMKSDENTEISACIPPEWDELAD